MNFRNNISDGKLNGLQLVEIMEDLSQIVFVWFTNESYTYFSTLPC